MLTRVMRVTRGLVEHAAIIAATWFGSFGGIGWAANLARFYVWMSVVVLVLIMVAVLAAIAADKFDEWGDPPERDMPRWLGWPPFLATVGMLVAAGWMVTAVAYTTTSVLMWLIVGAWRLEAKERKAREADPC